MAYAHYRRLYEERRERKEEPVVSTELVTTYARRPPETYHPSRAPIQPSPPPSVPPTQPEPTPTVTVQRGLRRGVEPSQIEMIRARAREYPERVWKPPIELAGAGAGKAYIEEISWPYQQREPKTITALRRFKALEEKVAGIPGFIGVRYTPKGPRPYEQKPLVQAIQPLKFPLGVVAEVEAFVRPEVPTVSGALFTTGAYAVTHGGRFPSKAEYEKRLRREEEKARKEFVTSLEAEEQRAKREYGERFSPELAKKWRKAEEKKFEAHVSKWRKTELAKYKTPIERVGELGPWYAAGSLLGAYITGTAFVKGAGKVWGGIKTVTPTRIKEPMAQWARFGLPARAAQRIRLWRIEHLPSLRWRKPPIARGEVAIPHVPERVGMPWLRASQVAWEMTQFPRTGGVWLGKYVVEPTTRKVLPHLISRGGVTTVGYLAEYGFRRETALTPLVSQTQLTRMGIYPYVPKPTVALGARAVSRVGAGLALTAFLRARPRQPPRPKPYAPTRVVPKVPTRVTPKIWQPTFAFEREKYTPLEVPMLEPKEREKLVPVPRLALAQVPKQPQIPVTEIPRLLIPKIPTPVPTAPARPAPFRPWWPRRGRGAGWPRRGKRRFGAWFYREHPIPKPREFRLRLIGNGKKRRKKKGFYLI